MAVNEKVPRGVWLDWLGPCSIADAEVPGAR